MSRQSARFRISFFAMLVCLLSIPLSGFAQTEAENKVEPATLIQNDSDAVQASPTEQAIQATAATENEPPKAVEPASAETAAVEPEKTETNESVNENEQVNTRPTAETEAQSVSEQNANKTELKAEEEESASIGEIVVTAARRKSSWKDAPAMVTVIEKEELERAPEKTVDDFLKRIPSVSFSRVHAAECGPGRDITLRGIHEQKRTLILLDGVPMNDGVTGAVNWSMIPKESINRIEIVRGPMSALYGSGAMGGVINIITKKPKNNNETLIKAGYGSLNTMTATLLQGGMFEKGGYMIGGGIYKTDGYIQAKDPEAYHVKNARTDMSVMGRFFLLPDDRSQLTLNVNYVNEDFSRGIFTDEQNNQIAMLSLSYEREMKNDINLSASAYAHFLMRKVDLGARPDYTQHEHSEFDDTMKFGELFQADFKVADFNTMTVGLDTSFTMMDKHNKYALVERKANAEGNQLLTSLFAQDEMKFVAGKHKFLLTPGVRMDYSRSGDGKSVDTAPGPNDPIDEDYQDRSWVAVNPKLSFVYRYDDMTTVRASAGRSFAAPTLFELYTVFTRGPLLLYGNPELDPESAWSGEIGLDQWFMKNFLGRLTAYYTRGYDFIGYRSIGENQSQVDNITEVQAIGVDAELQFDINEMWSLYGGYNFNYSTVISDDADATIEDNYLPFEPLHRARLGVVFKYLKWIAIDLSGRYEGERYVDLENTETKKLDHYISLDLALSGGITDYIQWSLAIENLLNEKYDVYSVPTTPSEAPGLLISGSLALSF